MPPGNLQEGYTYFSPKIKLYGVMKDVRVLQNGMELYCAHHYIGSLSTLGTFQKNCINRILCWKKSLLRLLLLSWVLQLGILPIIERCLWIMDKTKCRSILALLIRKNRKWRCLE